MLHTLTAGDSCSVWLLDLGLSWHQLSPSFSDYLRLATVHLGLRQWPYALTSNRLSPQYEYWFNVFAPHRLEVDQTHYLSHSQQPQQRQEEIMTGSGCGAVETTGINVVDVGKLLAAKPSREKSGSGRLKSASSSRQSSQRSATSRRSAATKD
ncbi:Tubulin polyglutamylase complex subunit 2 [Geodia barretti]|uniref:Tubulin polyglutamylase complex subunit 2 n=1 Tax=Geodia barretti TaxID=519541 RepID=A0AA35S0K4_GEOBA|nr:Tubulin polyglutamylase complex subunit 2 [Geodia barretti]